MLITPRISLAHALRWFVLVVLLLLLPTQLHAHEREASAEERPAEKEGAHPKAPLKGRICGTYFWDQNGNGIQENNEPGVEDRDIQVHSQQGNIVFGSASTSKGGHYCINLFDISPGHIYTVSVVDHQGWTPTYPLGPQDVVFSPQNGIAFEIIDNIDFGAR